MPIHRKREEQEMNELKDYKFSNYNHKIELEDKLYLYNAYSGGFCKLDDEFRDIISEISFEPEDDVNKLAELPKFIISGLIKGSFIIDKGIDEFALIKEQHLLSRFCDTNSLGLTLIPTMGCNFRCSYCFEADKCYPNDSMSDEVMDAIIQLIDTRLKDNGYLSVAWFGGEPLLKMDIIRKMQKRMNEIAKRKNLVFGASIVTNGYAMTKEISDELVELGIKGVQITVDGPQELHDSKRFLANGKGTFNKIIENILVCNSKLHISIRVNIEKDSLPLMPKFIDYLVEIGVNKKKNISVYFAIVRDYSSSNGVALCSCISVKEFAKEESKLNQMAHKKGLSIPEKINPNISLCSSLSPKGVVIEPDGTIQKCWGHVGESKSAVGNILEPTTSNTQYRINESKWYSWTGFDKKECRECKILPLCMGGCPLHTMDDSLKDNFKCSTYRYNLDTVLKLVALRHNEQAKNM